MAFSAFRKRKENIPHFFVCRVRASDHITEMCLRLRRVSLLSRLVFTGCLLTRNFRFTRIWELEHSTGILLSTLTIRTNTTTSAFISDVFAPLIFFSHSLSSMGVIWLSPVGVRVERCRSSQQAWTRVGNTLLH